jgi:hypothetical protein
MGIDWAKVSVEGAIALVVLGISGYAGYRFKKNRAKRKEAILLDLAEMRRNAVGFRNEGEKKELSGTDLTLWIEKVRQYQEKMIDKAKEFSPVEGTRLETLDRVQPLSYPHIRNPKQVQILRNLSERIKRLDKLLDKHQPPDK